MTDFEKKMSRLGNDRAFAEGQRKRIHEGFDTLLGNARAENRVQQIPLDEIDPFPNHPFQVRDDEDMAQLVESIREKGVITPATVRRKEDGRYELISGHRRKHACELAGLTELPALIVQMDDDEAVIRMVDANLQREHILPSEKAFAYKAKLDAMKRQGQRADLTCSQVGNKLQGKKSLGIIGEANGDSKNKVHRYIRLTCLNHELLQKADDGRLPFMTAVALSYLREPEQTALLGIMKSESCGSYVPQLIASENLKKKSLERQNAREPALTEDEIREVLFGTPPERAAQPSVSTEKNEMSAEELFDFEEETIRMAESLVKPPDPDEPRMKIVQGGDAATDDDLHVTIQKMNQSLAELDALELASRAAKAALKKLDEVLVWYDAHTPPEIRDEIAGALETLRKSFAAQGWDK